MDAPFALPTRDGPPISARRRGQPVPFQREGSATATRPARCAMTFRVALGHRNIKSTMRYVAGDAETVRTAAKVGWC
jgi:hypothetical protein